ncbi:MAG: Mur ligase family protein, partial [bacterium]|nr:Mur ligase family protein [bacterium]
SHQLSGLKKSPNVAVFLNIYPEHLDYYRNFQEYLKAKQNICRYQKKDDFLLFNSRDKYVQETARFAKGKKIILSSDKAKSFMKKWGRPGLSIKLLGSFNFLNMAAAIEVGRIFKVPDKIIAKVISAFKPLPHRLEFVGEYQSIKFYNDSLATIPEATIAALDALGRNVETIFLGGFDRGLKFDKLAGRIMRSNLKNIIFFPPSGVRIWKKIEMIQGQKKRFFRDLFIDPERNYDNKKTDLVYNGRSSGVSAMKTAVKWAYEHTSKGKICLLSCASPSFGLFKDYRERGELFKRFVRTLS